jgi:hypothetical protein
MGDRGLLCFAKSEELSEELCEVSKRDKKKVLSNARVSVG